MYPLLLCLAVSAPQAPAPRQAPPIRERIPQAPDYRDHKVPYVPCSSQCCCGCNDGFKCRCPPAKIGPSYRLTPHPPLPSVHSFPTFSPRDVHVVTLPRVSLLAPALPVYTRATRESILSC